LGLLQEDAPDRSELRKLEEEVTTVLQALMYWIVMSLSKTHPSWCKRHSYYLDLQTVELDSREVLLVSLLRNELNRLSMACALETTPVMGDEAFKAGANMLLTKLNSLHDAAEVDQDAPPWSS
jgi:hypothetical protein